jgi:hypothetical protein
MTQAEFNTALDNIATAAHTQFSWADKLEQMDHGILIVRASINDLYTLTEYVGPGELPV